MKTNFNIFIYTVLCFFFNFMGGSAQDVRKVYHLGAKVKNENLSKGIYVVRINNIGYKVVVY